MLTVVANLDEALQQSARYPDAVGFLIAPLNCKAGARSWHTLGDAAARWIQYGADDHTPPILLGFNTAKLPNLPISKTETWVLGFVDEKQRILSPEILIYPSGIPWTRIDQPQNSWSKNSEDIFATMIDMFKQEILDARLSSRNAQEIQSEIFAQMKTMLRELKDELKNTRQELETMRTKNANLEKVNAELEIALTQMRITDGFDQPMHTARADKLEASNKQLKKQA